MVEAFENLKSKWMNFLKKDNAVEHLIKSFKKLGGTRDENN